MTGRDLSVKWTMAPSGLLSSGEKNAFDISEASHSKVLIYHTVVMSIIITPPLALLHYNSIRDLTTS